MAHIHHPWQSGSAELISHALTHLHRQTDFDRRIAFLLMDVGVETLFKTFLTAPEKETKALGKFQDRKNAAEGNFYQLIIGVESAAGSHRLAGFNFSYVQFYHDTRNKLYHDGVGITVPESDVEAYAKLAVELLKILLNVDLDDELNRPEIEARLKSAQQQKDEAKRLELSQQIGTVAKSRQDLAAIARIAIERVEPRLALPSFERRFYALRNQVRDASFDKESRIFHSGKFAEDFSEKLRALLPMDMFPLDPTSGLVSPDWDPTHLYLAILQVEIVGGDGAWLGVYDMSRLYPEDQRPELIYDEQENIIDVMEPTHEEIVNAGKQWVGEINEMRRAIEVWLEGAQTSE